MEIFVDDKRIETESEDGLTLGDALARVQSDHCAPQQIIVAVRCNGNDVAAEDMSGALVKPITDFDRIEVLTGTKEALVIDVMTQAANTLDDSETESRRVAELLTEGKTVEARQNLGDCLRAWQQIHDAVAKSIGMLGLDAEAIMVRDETLRSTISKPRDVLVQVRDALLAGDDVLLADILQYEFADVTTTWHAIIARLRQEAEDIREKNLTTT
ncbi:MAG: hypothetical protein Q7R41_18835 [Phycisphaerales bacterium]|nr:hypothetical protein [Phycisphaerales bacterium]